MIHTSEIDINLPLEFYQEYNIIWIELKQEVDQHDNQTVYSIAE